MQSLTPDVYTKLLLNFDGADGSTTFTDECGKTMTRVGNPYLVSNSGAFLTSGDYLTVPDSEDWNFGTGDFTIDFWFMFNTLSNSDDHGFCGQVGTGNSYWYFVKFYTTMQFAMSLGSTDRIVYEWTIPTLEDSLWHYLELIRSGENLYLFNNMKEISATSIVGTLGNNTLPNVSSILTVGNVINLPGVDLTAKGWFDVFRISKGIARHTSVANQEDMLLMYDYFC